MIKKLFTKYFLEVVPSIVATVVGAYIVTHYINAKSEADKPKAAISAPAETSKDVAPQTLKADDSAEKAAKAEAAKEAARLKAEKLAAEKAATERAATERAEAAKKAAAEKLANEKASAERREKAVAKSAPPTQSPEANAASDDRRDANDLARAAIERLRNAKSSEKSSERSAEPHRAPDTARVEELAKPQDRVQERPRVNSVVYAPAAPQSSVQPLPPAVTVAPAPKEAAITAPPSQVPPPVTAAPGSRDDDDLRIAPPADIPSRPLDLRAKQGRTSVTEDVVSAARSVFHAVVPEPPN